MNHPAIKQTPALQTGSAIPWSVEREYRLRGRITKVWLCMWVLFIGALGELVIANFAKSSLLTFLAVSMLVAGVFFLGWLQRERAKLGEEMRRGPRGEFFEGSGMLANKPRSTRGLTEWVQHSVRQTDFVCNRPPRGCGRHHRWEDAKWIPNYDTEQFGEAEYPSTVDPGGGRFVILCPCGIGHFKLKPVTEQDIVDRAAAKDRQ